HTTPDEWVSAAALALAEAHFVDKPLYRPARYPGGVDFKPGSLFSGLREAAGWMDELIADRAKPDSVMVSRAEMAWLPERAAFWSAILFQRASGGSKRPTLQKWSTILDRPMALQSEARRESGYAWTSYFA